MAKQPALAVLTVTVTMPEDAVADTLEQLAPYEAEVERLQDLIAGIELGLGLTIEVTD